MTRLACLLLLWLVAGSARALPTLAELERDRAVIGKVYVDTRDIFDLTNAEEDNALFRLANRVHGTTRPEVVRARLLFAPGERVSVRRIEETERLLRALNVLYEVDIVPIAYEAGIVDLAVVTRDTWTLDVTASFSNSGGTKRTRLGIREQNLLGLGIAVGVSRTSDLDRTGTEFSVAYDHAFDGWTRLSALRGRFDDGRRTALTAERPFYSLDTRYAARAAWRDHDSVESIYNAGDEVAHFRHRLRRAELSAGWSPGDLGGRTHRVTAGFLLADDAYGLASASLPPPAPFPTGSDAHSVFLRHEYVEDRFARVRNHTLIERTEFLPLGWSTRLTLARLARGLGADRGGTLGEAAAARGWQLEGGHLALATLAVARRIGADGAPLTHAAGTLRYFAPVAREHLWYASLSADAIDGGGLPDLLYLGGTFGLRGYPTRYQAGEKRVLATLERRVYTPWYPFRLFRVGGAAFVDAGRAWGGGNENRVEDGWLANAGVGLRIAVDRTAFGNVLHLDAAMPLVRPAGVKRVEFTVKTELNF